MASPASDHPDLHALLASWNIGLRAERKSPSTITNYVRGVSSYLDWCATNGITPVLERRPVNAFVADMLEAGAMPATARSRQLALKRFAAWLVEEGELDTNDIAALKPPRLDVAVVEPFSDEELKALFKACAGPTFRDRRDEAILRFMLETGARAGEVVALRVTDISLAKGLATIRRGKGGKGRVVPYSDKTAKAFDRYLRLRRSHVLADSPNLWLGDRRKGFTYDGLYAALKDRVRLAGVEGFHPHRMRNTAAHRWLAAGGSEMGLLAVAGWTRPDMLLRYTRAQASERAAVEARHLRLGDL